MNRTLKGFGGWRTLSGLAQILGIHPQGWSAATTLGFNLNYESNPERVRRLANPFRVSADFGNSPPGLSLRSNPGLKLANAFGVTANAFGVTATAFGVTANAFGVTANAFGVTATAFGVKGKGLRRLFRTPRHARSALLLTALTILTVFALVFLLLILLLFLLRTRKGAEGDYERGVQRFGAITFQYDGNGIGPVRLVAFTFVLLALLAIGLAVCLSISLAGHKFLLQGIVKC